MNKKLLAIFLSFATITSFITATQAPKAELLAYLKNIKTHINEFQHTTNEESKILEEEYGTQFYKEVTNIWHELYTTIPAEIISEHTKSIDFSFDFTHEGLKELKKQGFKELCIDLMTMYPFVGQILCDELEKDQAQQIKRIFNKYGKNTSQPAEEILHNFFNTEDNWNIGMMIDCTRFINILLSKIDAKITELEKQQ